MQIFLSSRDHLVSASLLHLACICMPVTFASGINIGLIYGTNNFVSPFLSMNLCDCILHLTSTSTSSSSSTSTSTSTSSSTSHLTSPRWRRHSFALANHRCSNLQRMGWSAHLHHFQNHVEIHPHQSKRPRGNARLGHRLPRRNVRIPLLFCGSFFLIMRFLPVVCVCVFSPRRTEAERPCSIAFCSSHVITGRFFRTIRRRSNCLILRSL
jgi:hypothetical protein